MTNETPKTWIEFLHRNLIGICVTLVLCTIFIAAGMSGR